jgi:2-polyprenyl-3-methyl-5-hydroxy-6-metoxy-1,4-benzoquinol methylase
MYGSEKSVVEKSPLKRFAYRLFGEVHVAGRIRAEHVIREIRRFKDFPNRPISILDAGTSRGDLAIYLARKYSRWNVTGLEVEKEKTMLAEKIRENIGLKNVKFISGDMTSMSFQEQFDLATSTDVLEHIENDESALVRLKASLKSGGTLIVTFPAVPQRKHLRIVERKQKAMGFNRTSLGHVRDGYSVREITQKLQKQGFEEIRCIPIFGMFGTLAYDIFFCIGDNKPNPLVYLLCLPLFMALGFLDVSLPIQHGSGLMVTAKKKR